MRKFGAIKFFVTFILVLNLSYSNGRVESIKNKKIKNQIVYFQNETTPFTGEMIGVDRKEEYKNGIKHGMFQGIVKDEDNEKLFYEGRYVNGIKHGTWMIKYPNKSTKVILRYNYDKPNGQWAYFYENQKIESYENLEDGILSGKVVKYTQGGNLLSQLNYEHGLLNGEATFFYKTGVLETVTYFKFGKLDGKFKMFSRDGAPFLEGKYRLSKRTGSWNFFYKTGDIKTSVNYKNGYKDGAVVIYDKAGLIADKFYFKNGDEINKEGGIISKRTKFKDAIIDRFKKFNRNLKYEKYDRILTEME